MYSFVQREIDNEQVSTNLYSLKAAYKVASPSGFAAECHHPVINHILKVPLHGH